MGLEDEVGPSRAYKVLRGGSEPVFELLNATPWKWVGIVLDAGSGHGRSWGANPAGMA